MNFEKYTIFYEVLLVNNDIYPINLSCFVRCFCNVSARCTRYLRGFKIE